VGPKRSEDSDGKDNNIDDERRRKTGGVFVRRHDNKVQAVLSLPLDAVQPIVHRREE
jgi:hypothetical protein